MKNTPTHDSSSASSLLQSITKNVALERLRNIPAWKLDDSSEELKITRTWTFDDFKAAMAFVNRVAEKVEQDQHHPDILIHYNKVTLVFWTHSVGGLSENDFKLAGTMNELFKFS